MNSPRSLTPRSGISVEATTTVPAAKLRVLIIDDDREVAETIAQAFTDAHVGLCADPERGLARAVTESWDLILCDMMMPGLTGQDVYERIGAEAPDKLERVVFVTGGGFTPKIRAFLDHQGPRVLSKPASLEELRALLV